MYMTIINSFLLLSQKRGDLVIGSEHQGLNVYKVYINDDPGLTLTYFRKGQIWSHICLYRENVFVSCIKLKLAINRQND